MPSGTYRPPTAPHPTRDPDRARRFRPPGPVRNPGRLCHRVGVTPPPPQASGPRFGLSRVLHASARLVLGRFDCPPGHVLWRQDNQIGELAVLAIAGPGVEIRMAGRPTVVAHPGCVMLYEPRQVYARRRLDDRGDACVFLGVEPGSLRAALVERDPAAADRDALFTAPRAALAPADYAAAARLARALEHRPVDRLAADEALASVLHRVLAGVAPPPPAPSEAHRALALALERHLAARFAEDDDLATLAAAARASPYHAARVFRACTGTSLHAYRNHLRLCAALDRLADPRRDLAALALDLGYSSHSHFTTAFRRAFGCPPSAVRPFAAASTILKAPRRPAP
jgi:AraC family transcriptional regulator